MEVKENENQYLRSQNQDFLNRLQSKEFETYSRLTHGTKVEFDPIRPMTDAEELIRLSTAQGLGESIYEPNAGDDPEFRETLAEFGLSQGEQ